MSFRYQYTATMSQATVDENGDPITGTPVSFKCDYQPNVNDISINVGGSNIPVSYQLYVPKSNTMNFKEGSEISCNGDKGTVILAVPNKFGTLIYVKG